MRKTAFYSFLRFWNRKFFDGFENRSSKNTAFRFLFFTVLLDTRTSFLNGLFHATKVSNEEANKVSQTFQIFVVSNAILGPVVQPSSNLQEVKTTNSILHDAPRRR
jgi:hypothetical protein